MRRSTLRRRYNGDYGKKLGKVIFKSEFTSDWEMTVWELFYLENDYFPGDYLVFPIVY
jgi:hypothetical protein